MKVIVHVGMGKTGTTSIQQALRTQPEHLADQNAAYLGMWFDIIDRQFKGFEGFRAFARLPSETLVAHAERFAELLAKQAEADGTETFILSNESLYESLSTIRPFLETLRDLCDLQLVLYVRDPKDWLPSAYAQWGVRHKTAEGPIQPFEVSARKLVRQYSILPRWPQAFDDVLTIRRYDSKIDVVKDFADTIGVDLGDTPRRALERAEPAELLLRALFNDHFDEPVLPERFSRVMLNSKQMKPLDVDEMIARCFDHSATDDILRENDAMFSEIRERTGLDLMANANAEHQKAVDETALKARLFDYIVEILFIHARRLQRLERQERIRESGEANGE